MPIVDPVPPVALNSLVVAMLSNAAPSTDILNKPCQEVALNSCKAFALDASGNPSSSTFFTEAQFVDLFYPSSSGYFYVSEVNSLNPALVLMDQTYTSPEGLSIFSLYQVVLEKYLNGDKNFKSISYSKLMKLQKECIAFSSLCDIKGDTHAIAWHDVILSLTQQGILNPGKETDDALVNLKVILKFHSYSLDFTLDIIFNYDVSIPGYTVVTAAALPI